MEPDFLSRIRFLLVETPQGPLGWLLRDYGLEVQSVDDAATLEQALARSDPHVAVVDLETPGVETEGLLRRIRRRSLPVPVIVVSRREASGLLELVSVLNLAHLLAPPVDEVRFMAEVAKCAHVLARRGERERLAQETRILGRLVRLALAGNPLETCLQQALDLLLDSVGWLQSPCRGAVFLVQEEAEPHLKMVARRGLEPDLEIRCAEVPLNRGLCGLTAVTGALPFVSCVDEHYDIRIDDLASHGQYNVPLLHQDRLLGVLVLYPRHGHRFSEQERRFLHQVADILVMDILLAAAACNRLEPLQPGALEAADRLADEIHGAMQEVADHLHFLRESFRDMDRLLAAAHALAHVACAHPELESAAGVVEALEEEIDLEILRREIPRALAQAAGELERIATVMDSMKDSAQSAGKGIGPLETKT